MSKSVLIIGPRYYNYLSATAHAFEQLGWTTYTESYDKPIHPYTTAMKWRYKLSTDKPSLQAQSRALYKASIEKRFTALHPDVVFILNGDILDTDTLDYFRESSKVLLWLFDNREKIPESIGHIDHVDCMFCFEQRDAQWYQQQGKQAYFLPQACDTHTYYPLDTPKDIDLLFVGELYYSPRRQQIIHDVIEHFPQLRIKVFGLYKPWFKNPVKWLFREHRHIYENRNICAEEVNRYYNRSRIVLNIHQEQQQEGANPRTFEICGSCSYQLCDSNPYIDQLFPPHCIGLYHSTDELLTLIEKALHTDTTSEAQRAYHFVQEHHSFVERIRQALNTANVEI